MATIEIPIVAKMTVDEGTAKACLKIVEIFLNSHADLHIKTVTKDTGELELNYEPIK